MLWDRYTRHEDIHALWGNKVSSLHMWGLCSCFHLFGTIQKTEAMYTKDTTKLLIIQPCVSHLRCWYSLVIQVKICGGDLVSAVPSAVVEHETSALLPLLSRKANQFPHATHCTLLPSIKSHRSEFQLPLPPQRSSLAIGWICVFLSFPDPPKSCFVEPELPFQNLVGIPSTLEH